jgi:hypothetical protein
MAITTIAAGLSGLKAAAGNDQGSPKIGLETRLLKYTILTWLTAAVSFGQEQPIQDLNQLIGKQVIAQRIPLCQPGTFTQVLAYVCCFRKP